MFARSWPLDRTPGSGGLIPLGAGGVELALLGRSEPVILSSRCGAN